MKIIGKSAAEIFESVRAQVNTGVGKAGERLPAVRELAGELGVNRNTVAAAYRKLTFAGILETGGRRGTVVREQRMTPQNQEGFGSESKLVDLASGNPNPDWLPDLSDFLSSLEIKSRMYGAPTIDPELEMLGRRWFENDCPEPFELDLTSGAVDAIERLASTYLLFGDTVAVEDPCFLGSINALRFLGIPVAGVSVDSEGMLPLPLEKVLAAGAKAVLFTPRAHNPTGCSLSKNRSRELRKVLEKYPNVFVIIDDHSSLIVEADYHSVLSPKTVRWALIRSVAKIYGPDLRFAFVASDRRTSERLRCRLNSGTNWVSHLLQDIVRQCLESRNVNRLISEAKKDYAKRRRLLLMKLTGIDSLVSPSDGLNIWIPLQRDSNQVALALASRGWLVRTGDAFAVEAPANAIRVTISGLDQGNATKFVSDLRDCLAV
jgi:DNA-binding transcriptional MocR family regulator